MKNISLTAVALLGAVLLAPMGTATAAGETCQGQAATIVGTPGGQLTGTGGADVIVTNGATQVDALGGDDVVCVTGGSGINVILGAGADTFYDLNGQLHSVFAGTEDGIDTEVDVIRTGFSVVRSGMAGQPNADTIDLASGFLFWNGIQIAPGAVTMGSGSLLLRSAYDVRVEASGSVTGSDTSLTWTGDIDNFAFATESERGTFTFRGTNARDTLKVDAPAKFNRDVQLGSGDDTYRTNGLGGRSSMAKGNRGEDTLMLDVPTLRLKADLDRRVDDKNSEAATRIRRFESYVVSAKTANVRGTNRGDTMGLVACRVNVNGGPGKDAIKHSAGYGPNDAEEGNAGLAAFGVFADLGTPRCGTYRAVIVGGRGRDTIVGGPGTDRLVGGPGKDRVNGGPRRDVCQGERVQKCERRA
jgi:hypothetical protein